MNTQKKSKKPMILKQFRLIDFNVYDHDSNTPNTSNDDDSASTSASSSDYEEETLIEYRASLKNVKIEKTPKTFRIQMFGLNETGETCCIYIKDFQPFFYIKVSDNWTEQWIPDFFDELKRRFQYYKEGSIVSIQLVDKKKLYGFTANKLDKFLCITFANIESMNKVKNFWYSYDNDTRERKRQQFTYRNNRTYQTTNLILYESNIPPLLRYFHITNISPSGWIYLPVNRVEIPTTKTTTCTYEYICSIKQVIANNQKETRVPYKICSFDIEASSSHGDFPVPIKTYKKLATNIVDIIQLQQKQQSASNDINNDTINELLRDIILTAFGFGKLVENVDLVYPKRAPTASDIQEKIKDLLEKSVAGFHDLNKNYANSVESFFEKQYKSTNQFRDDDDVDGGDDADIDAEEDVNEIDDFISDNEDEQPIIITKKAKTSASHPPKQATKKLCDLLLSSEYTRDEKIQYIIKAMESASFPKLEGDKTTFIGSTFMYYGDDEPYYNNCLVVGSCDKLDGIDVKSVPTERDLLLQWTELIQKENPDIIIGYNIFGFDYEFLFRRSQENGCEHNFLKLSRKIEEVCAKELRDGGLEIENAKIALASGEYDLRYFKMTGRLQIDMLCYFRRGENLSSYKLDDVAGLFISDDIKKIECATNEQFGDVTELYTTNLTGLHVGDYIHIQIIGFTNDYYKEGKKFQVLDIIFDKETPEVDKRLNKIIIQGHYTDIDRSKKNKWGVAKDDVSPQDIFRLTNGSSRDRSIVAKYCIQDCNLVHHLMKKKDVITGFIEMSRICSVPISFLVFRGQGIKLTSFVAKKCSERGTLMPDLEKSCANDGYEGAIVLPPKCSMYMDNPVACVDYSSLYPSSMISENLSHDSKVWTKEYDLAGNLIKEWGEKDKEGNYIYDNLPGLEYINTEYDTYVYKRKTPTSRAEKVISGKKICRWVQETGIMPMILKELLKAREDTKKLKKKEKDPFMQEVLEQRQLGYKVTANSLYGQCGAKTSTFYEKDVAASTTATGRKMIIYAKEMIEENYGNGRYYDTKSHGMVLTNAEYIYGDSVISYTPILVRYNENRTEYMTIEYLGEKYGNNRWVSSKDDKEYCELSYHQIETWTEKGWTRLHRIIRHQLAKEKKMYRIVSPNGIVDCTDDHSLLSKNGDPITPKELQIQGQELLFYPLQQGKMESSNVLYKHEAVNAGYTFCVCGNDIPEIDVFYVLFEPREMRIEFLRGYLMAYCEYYDPNIEVNIERIQRTGQLYLTNIPTQLKAGFLMKLLQSLDFNHIELDYNEMEGYCIRDFHYIEELENPNLYRQTVKDIIDITNDFWNYKNTYVYDLTTENHHFAAGVGDMIVHNTDSVFFTFNLSDPTTGEKIRGNKALEITIEIAQNAAELCTKFLKEPMSLAYEKTMMPFILLSKKRYVSMLYETDPKKGKMKFMGLSLKRRDSCDYLKDTYGGCLNRLMSGAPDSILQATEFLKQSLLDLKNGKVSMDKLVITKSLKSDYKNPDQIAHRVLANRIGKREVPPKPGDRIKYLFILPSQSKNKKMLMGDRIETPQFIAENKLKIDYTYYITNQLMKPLSQLFGLAIVQIWEATNKKKAIIDYNKEIEKMKKEFTDMETFMKQKEKYCSTLIKNLLFQKILTDIQNESNGIRTLDTFITSRKNGI